MWDRGRYVQEGFENTELGTKKKKRYVVEIKTNKIVKNDKEYCSYIESADIYFAVLVHIKQR
jgi:hypothetical protein